MESPIFIWNSFFFSLLYEIWWMKKTFGKSSVPTNQHQPTDLQQWIVLFLFSFFVDERTRDLLDFIMRYQMDAAALLYIYFEYDWMPQSINQQFSYFLNRIEAYVRCIAVWIFYQNVSLSLLIPHLRPCLQKLFLSCFIWALLFEPVMMPNYRNALSFAFSSFL